MVRVGITGGIGSGKSTICRVWEQCGAFIIHADELAKTIMVEQPSVVASIKKSFGEQAYLPDGSLNRAYLAGKAFGEARVDELNAIVHPEVYKQSDALMQQAALQGYPMAVREAAILLQYGRPSDLEVIVLVLSDAMLRSHRVIQRDHTTASAVQARMGHQPVYETYIPLADFVVYNDGSLEALEQKAQSLYQELLAISKNGN